MTNDRGGLQFGDFTLDVSERRLLRGGRPVPLAPKAFDVLAALAARPGHLMTKDELLKEVWPDSFVEESNLAYHVFALRRALGETAEGESYVETVPKRGYRFNASVTAVKSANGEGLSPATLAADAGPPQAVVLGAAEHPSHDHSSEKPHDRGTAGAGSGEGSVAGVQIRWPRRSALVRRGRVYCRHARPATPYPRRPPVVREPIRVESLQG